MPCFFSFLKVLNLTRHVTLENNTHKAKEKFIKILNRSEMFYNKEEIPENESNETAHKLCSSISGAKKYCPVRWNAMQNWFAHAREVRPFVKVGLGKASLKHIQHHNNNVIIQILLSGLHRAYCSLIGRTCLNIKTIHLW